MKKILSIFIFSIIAIAPFTASAQIYLNGPFQSDGTYYNNTGPATTPTTQVATGNQCTANLKTLSDVINLALCYISRLIIPLLFAVAILVFIWGVVQFIANADNEEKRTQGRSFMIYGIIALFVMISVWGLVNLVSNTFGVKNVIPQLQSQQN